MGRRYFSVVGMAIALTFVLAACGSTDEDEASPSVTRIPDAANAPVLTPEGGSPEAGTAQALEIVSVDIAFDPTSLTIPADSAVTVSLPNEGAAPHNFSIDELEISVDIAPGETQEAEVNAPTGEYEYYCDVPGHREAGMVGTLIVE